MAHKATAAAIAPEEYPTEEYTEATTREYVGDAEYQQRIEMMRADFGTDVTLQGNESEAQAPSPKDPAPTTGDNVKKIFKAFMGRVDKYGKAAGQGDASLPALALEAVRMAADRVIGIEKAAAGADDDAAMVYTAFQEAKAKARGTIYEKESSFKAQVSKFRQIVTLGATLYDVGVETMERAAAMHTAAGKNDALKADMRSGTLYAFLVDVAREQNKEEHRGEALSDKQLEAILFPAQSEKKTDIERVKAAIKSLEKLRDGTKGDDGFKPIDSAYLDASIDNMNELLCDLDPSHRDNMAKLEAAKETLAQFGIKVSKRAIARVA